MQRISAHSLCSRPSGNDHIFANVEIWHIPGAANIIDSLPNQVAYLTSLCSLLFAIHFLWPGVVHHIITVMAPVCVGDWPGWYLPLYAIGGTVHEGQKGLFAGIIQRKQSVCVHGFYAHFVTFALEFFFESTQIFGVVLDITINA